MVFLSSVVRFNSRAPVNEADRLLARLLASDVVDDGARSALRLRHAGDVRCEDDLWMRPEGMVRRQRFRLRDVDHGGRQMPAIERVQKGPMVELRSPPDVDKRGPCRQSCKQVGTEKASRFRRQRKKADRISVVASIASSPAVP